MSPTITVRPTWSRVGTPTGPGNAFSAGAAPHHRSRRKPYGQRHERESAMTRGPLLVLLSVACAQTGSALARTLFGELGATGVLLLRLGIAALVFGVVLRPRVQAWPAAA